MVKASTKIISTSRPVKASCKNTKVRSAAGECVTGRKPMMKSGGSTKSFPDLNKDGKITKADILIGKKVIPKAQAGISKGTPFQGYMKKPGAVASDTVAMTIRGGKRSATASGVMDIKAKNPKNQKTLERAYEKTYGDDIKTRYSDPAPGETSEQYNRRMGPMKKGGTVHPGFKAVQSKIAAKQGISKEAAGAILASSTRKASAKAKSANPRLKKVK
jgi:hypothetical protein